jgi:ATP-dependent helicase HrpB
MTRLVTERASQAAATQRAGRAARQGPGVAYRLWEEAATAGLPRFDPPEILEADLSALVLDCAIWGVADPRALAWLDPPPEAAVAEGRARLAILEALDADGRPTAHGRAIAKLPMPPRLAHMLVRAGEMGLAREAAEVAVLLGERGLGGPGTDLETRTRRFRTERGRRAESARRLAERWSAIPLPLAGGARGGRVENDGKRKTSPPPTPPVNGRGEETAIAVALAFPDRISRRRDASGERWASVGGRGFKLDATDPLATAQWLAVAETQGIAAGARILSAAAIDQATVEALFADKIETRRTFAFDPATGGVEAVRERRLGAIALSRGPDSNADPAAIAAALVDGVRGHGLHLLPWGEASAALRDRAAFATAHGWGGALDDETLAARLDDWLAPLLDGKRRLSQLSDADLAEALRNLAGWDAMRALDRVAPARLETPAGSSHAIDYAAEAGPTVELRPQALFGLATHPVVANGVPLVLSLTSPAGRPIQTTRDLPGFWAGSWAAIAKEMRGRYPKHPWPDDPAAANPTLRTKKADARFGKSG